VRSGTAYAVRSPKLAEDHMSTLVHLTVGICLLSAVALLVPRAEATASVAPGSIHAAVGKSHAVELAAAAVGLLGPGGFRGTLSDDTHILARMPTPVVGTFTVLGSRLCSITDQGSRPDMGGGDVAALQV
jgi:hypothetical protein